MVDIGPPLISYGQAPEPIEPREGAFDDPSMPAKLFFTFYSFAAIRGRMPRWRQASRQRG